MKNSIENILKAVQKQVEHSFYKTRHRKAVLTEIKRKPSKELPSF